MSSSYVLLSDLSAELGLDKSNLRKYVLKHGFTFIQARTPESRGQAVLALTAEDAEAIRELRRRQGYTCEEAVENGNGHGYFYIVQIAPDLSPLRLKLGFASDAERRLAAYRTLSPTACIVKTWPCHSSWERAAIASITRIDCKNLSNEVFECPDLQSLIGHGDAFFSLMP